MSLNQAFLKLYGEKSIPQPNPASPAEDEQLSRRETPGSGSAEGMNISLRVDQGETSVSERFAAMREARARNVFSIEEERRRRNPQPEQEYGGPAWSESGNAEPGETASDSSSRQAAEEDSDLHARSRRESVSEPEEPDVIRLRPRREAARPEDASALLSLWDGGVLERTAAYSMPIWPAEYLEIFLRGKIEFSQLADVVVDAARKGNKIFGFGGWGNGTGVSTLVLGILDEMLRRRKRVLLLDADFQHPQMAEILGIPAEPGWESLLRSSESGDDRGLVRVETAEAPFWVLPLQARNVPEAVAVSCRKKWFRAFLELAEQFDLVLIDHGSLCGGSCREKVLELLRFGCDGYFMVTDARRHPQEVSSSMPAASDEYRLPCFGVIENFT